MGLGSTWILTPAQQPPHGRMSDLHPHPQISFSSLHHCQSLDVGRALQNPACREPGDSSSRTAPEGYKDPLLLACSGAKRSSWLKNPLDFPVTQPTAAAAVGKSRAVRALSSQHSELFGEAVFYFWMVAQQDRAPTAAPGPSPPRGPPAADRLCRTNTSHALDAHWVF